MGNKKDPSNEYIVKVTYAIGRCDVTGGSLQRLVTIEQPWYFPHHIQPRSELVGIIVLPRLSPGAIDIKAFQALEYIEGSFINFLFALYLKYVISLSIVQSQ